MTLKNFSERVIFINKDIQNSSIMIDQIILYYDGYYKHFLSIVSFTNFGPRRFGDTTYYRQTLAFIIHLDLLLEKRANV